MGREGTEPPREVEGPCPPEDAPDLPKLCSKRKKDQAVMAAVIVHGVGTHFPDAAARQREETRLRDAVRHARTLLYDLLQHRRLAATALPVILELQVSISGGVQAKK